MANKQGTTPRRSLQAVRQPDADRVRAMIRRTVEVWSGRVFVDVQSSE